MPYDEYADLITALAHKDFLAVHQVAVFFSVGINKMYTMVRTPGMDFVVWYEKCQDLAQIKMKSSAS